MRYMITDEMWAVIEKCLAKAKIEKRGRPAEISDRDFLEALLYLARTGIPWRDLPREFGKWDAIYNRYRRWLKNGTLQRLFELLTAHPELAAIRRILIDATNVRAHRCAAGAPKKGLPPSRVLVGSSYQKEFLLSSQSSASEQGLSRKAML
jgi:transposase